MNNVLPSTPSGNTGSSPWKWIKRIAGAATVTVLLAGGGVWYGINTKINDAKRQTKDGLEFYDELMSKKERITDIYGEDGSDSLRLDRIGASGEYIPIEKINPKLIVSLLAAEDQRFWEHDGFDKAAIRGMLFDEIRGKTRGGSTVLSLIAKNFGEDVDVENWLDDIIALFWGQNKVNRLNEKIGERVQAIKLGGVAGEDQQSTQKIQLKLDLVGYALNFFEFVPGTQGIEQASWGAFNKPQSQLFANQAAALTGSLKNPRLYNLLSTDPAVRARNEQRTDEVLGDMQRTLREHIFPDFFFEEFVDTSMTEEKLEDLKQLSTISTVKKNRSKHLPKQSLIPYTTPSIIAQANALIREKQQEYNDDFEMGYDPDVERGGCKIFTTINTKLQQGIMDSIEKYTPHLEKGRNHPKDSLCVSVLVIDNATGAVLADVGGRDHKKNQVNYGTSATEIGSLMKYIDSGCALELGIISSMEETYVDTAYTLFQKDYAGITDPNGWTPKNFGMSGKDSLVWSNDTLSYGEGGIVKSNNNSMASIGYRAAQQGKAQQYIDLIEYKLGLLGITIPVHLNDNAQLILGNITAPSEAIAKMYMSVARGGTFLSSFHTIQLIRGPKDAGIYDFAEDTLRQPQEVVLFSPEIVAKIKPYLEQKGKAVLGANWEEGDIDKTGTAARAHVLNHASCVEKNIRLVAVSEQGVTIIVKVGGINPKFAYGHGVDATGKLRPLYRSVVNLLRNQK